MHHVNEVTPAVVAAAATTVHLNFSSLSEDTELNRGCRRTAKYVVLKSDYRKKVSIHMLMLVI